MRTFLIILISFLFLECKLEDDSKLFNTQICKSSIESFKNKVFIRKYNPSLSKLKVNNHVYLIKDIWSENSWMYEKYNSDYQIKKDTSAQLILVFDKLVENDEIGVSLDSLNKTEFGYKTGILNLKLSSNQLKKDTLILYLFKNFRFEQKDFIQKLILIKK